MRFYAGQIEGFSGSWGSGLAVIVIGGTPVHCDNGATVRALDAAFPGFIAPGHTVNPDRIDGERIIYSYDEMGMCLGGFTPESEWYGPDVPDGPDGIELEYHEETGEWEVAA